MENITNFDKNGKENIVYVSQKEETLREAIAKGSIVISREVIKKIKYGTIEKGDVLGVARVAGIMAAKKTFELIPMCHVLLLTKCSIEFRIIEETNTIEAECLVRTKGKTGVEMEALTGVSTALLTIYDMCKAVDKSMVIKEMYLEKKTGGKSGEYRREEN